LLMDEMGLCDTVDPLAGSYYVETLTNQMRGKMEAVMAEVAEAGGIVEMVKDGRIQAKVSEQAYDMHKDIESGEFPKVGVNRYRIEEDDEHEVEFHPYNIADAEMQIESLRGVRSRRDTKAASAALAKVKGAAEAGDNVMPAIMEAVKAYATVGEITDAMVEVYGRYEEPIRF